jgi:1-acyl-sn-glycerol-3-phosphate acyltransferase
VARTRKTVLGDNPFSSEPAAPETKNERAPTSPTADGSALPHPSPPEKPARKAKTKGATAAAQIQPIPSRTRKPTATKTPSNTQPKKSQTTPASQPSVSKKLVPSSPQPVVEKQTSAEEPSERKPSFSIAEEPRDRSEQVTEPIERSDAGPEAAVSDYFSRQWGRQGMRNRAETIDDFGYDRDAETHLSPLLDFLHDRYFRVEVEGAHHIPASGRALIVANHAGAFPYDGIMLRTALRKSLPADRQLRWLVEDHWFYMPFVGAFLNRMGAVRACQDNAQRLLQQERLVAVFPEGAKGTGRLFKDKHKLQRFGRGGFVRLCLRTQTPIIPCAILGGEESMPLLCRIESFAHLIGVPHIPITPTFPWLGVLGAIPAPTRWQFIFGEPIQIERHSPSGADDTVLVGRLTERVRATIQVTLDRASASRRSVWFGG